jgi:hypothetical protein
VHRSLFSTNGAVAGRLSAEIARSIAMGSALMKRSLVLLTLLMGLRAERNAAAAQTPDVNWPQFRGPGARGVAHDARLPERWSATQNVAWKTPIPGRGWSSPIVWGQRVFLTTAVNSGDTEPPKKGLNRFVCLPSL